MTQQQKARPTQAFDSQSIYVQRAEYYDPPLSFDFKWQPIPRRQFLNERDLAFDLATGTAEVPLDISSELSMDYPATTPLILCRYLRIAASEEHLSSYKASGEIFFVMQGTGHSVNTDDRIEWGQGDLFCFPGGGQTIHRAGQADCLLFCTTNEPQLAFEHLEPPLPGNAPIETVHYPAQEITQRFEAVFDRPRTTTESGQALLFSSAAVGRCRNTLPSLNVTINTLQAGGDQRPHRHNGVAVTLALEGEDIYSMIEGQRINWSPGAVQITPPTELHSHHNRGSKRMMSLIIQDEGVHYYTRTPGFSWG